MQTVQNRMCEMIGHADTLISDVHSFRSILLNAWDDFHRVSATFATESNLNGLKPVDIAAKWQIDAVVKSVIRYLLPADWSLKHTAGCVAAFCFLKVTLSVPLESVTACSLSFQELSLGQLFQRVDETVNARNDVDCANDLILPPVAHAFGLLSELLHDSSKRQLISRILEFLHSYWKPFGSLLIKICSNVIIKQSGLPTDEQEVLLYELLLLWKRALQTYSSLEETHPLWHDSSAFSLLVDALQLCLIDYAQQAAPLNVSNSSDEFKSSVDLLHPSIAHLLIRSLRSLCKFVRAADWLCSLQTTLDSIVLRLICAYSERANCADNTQSSLGPLVSSLARSVAKVNDETELQMELLKPDPCISLRLIILTALELAVRLDLSEPALFELLRSIHSLVFEARNAHCIRPVYECLMVTLLAGDDAHLFHGLTLCLQLENCILARSCPGDQSLLDLVPNAHQLFASLASTIGYSPHLLVDWAVSPETSCLSYLVHYLRRFRSGDSLGPEPVNSRAAPPIGTDWPATQLGEMLDKLARCLRTLESSGSVPFSPKPLIRSLNYAVSVIQNKTMQTDPHSG
ncbi:hypothetical protein EG68_07904 [Paragonimus skrjabini miyazakii]|uniref:Uncharacterized protein n=1 Tax=Paragonimus skrjabini miyazakii TaxID=59628 RepID=A0A8S9YCR0_9TREM|nr:hypothetical protein EG68_07904 [Paragonimus skrjabini miyazakii]